MIAIRMTFPAGRYHATPWGRHVNEGAVEWPPSPWRVLRALVAVWYQKCPELAVEQVRPVIEALTALPHYYLPQALVAHTRHYMPLRERSNTTKVFDTFVVLPKPETRTGAALKDRAVWMYWPDISFDSESHSVLSTLTRRLGYLGRAESWVTAELCLQPDIEPNVRPLADEEPSGSGNERTRILSATVPQAYDAWVQQARTELRQQRLAQRIASAQAKGKSVDSVKLTTKELAAIDEMVPSGLFAAIQADTETLRDAGWNYPPGSRWTDYALPKEIFAPQAVVARHRPASVKPTAARFALVSKVSPSLTDAVRFADRARKAVMSHSRAVNRRLFDDPEAHASPVFSGKGPAGEPLATGHRHAHYLPEANSDCGHITHLTIHAPMGLARDDIQALQSLAEWQSGIWQRSGHNIRLILLGFGEASELAGDPSRPECSILARSKVWVSRTPFIPTQHLHIRPRDRCDPETLAAATQRELCRLVRRELALRPWFNSAANDVEIEPLMGRYQGTYFGSRFVSWLKFVRERANGHGTHAGPHGYGFRIRFSEPVTGPIVLGYGCHFGLGQFVPGESE